MKLSFESHATFPESEPPSGTRCRKSPFLTEHVHQIIDNVVLRTGVTAAAIRGRGRTKKVAEARHLAWLAMYENGMSYPEIGSVFGCHHTTIRNGVRKALGLGPMTYDAFARTRVA